MIAFIEEHREVHGVEPICRVLPIAPSTFYAHAAIARDPDLRQTVQTGRDDKEDQDAFDDSKRYGARKIWHELRQPQCARCTVERLMKDGNTRCCARSKADHHQPDTSQPCPDDKVNRDFTAACQTSSGSVIYLCLKLAGYGLRGFRYRRLRSLYCGLACVHFHDDRLRAGCP